METLYDQHADYWLAKKKIPGDLWSEIKHLTDRNLKVLDLGCGGGRVAAGLVPYFGEVYAVDSSSNLLSRAAAANPDVRFVCGDFQRPETWAIMDTRFDLIVSNCAIRKDLCDLSAVGDLCHFYLNPEGIIVFRMQGFQDLPGLMSSGYRRAAFYDLYEIQIALKRFDVVIHHERYQQRFSSREYVKDMLERIGLPATLPSNRVQERNYYLLRGTRI